MAKLNTALHVRHYNWLNGDNSTSPAIRIDCGSGFLVIPYERGRALVDEVHDLCDEYERKQRETNE